jgi:hypothetical protein
VSYLLEDVIADQFGEEVLVGLDVDALEGRLHAVQEFVSGKNADSIYELAEEWHREHFILEEMYSAPEYVRGVYVGLLKAARELQESGRT